MVVSWTLLDSSNDDRVHTVKFVKKLCRKLTTFVVHFWEFSPFYEDWYIRSVVDPELPLLPQTIHTLSVIVPFGYINIGHLLGTTADIKYELPNIKNLEIEFLVIGSESYPNSWQWVMESLVRYCSEVVNLTIKYVLPPNVSPEGGSHVELVPVDEIQNYEEHELKMCMMNLRFLCEIMPNLRTILLQVECPHGPWGRESNNYCLLYEDIGWLRRVHPYIDFNIHI